jgi:hypothetical protein
MEEETVDEKMMITEFIGSLAVVYFASSAADPAMAAGLVLAVMMMAFPGAMILPWLTIGRMASGGMDPKEGALAFMMQLLGGIVAYSIHWWTATATYGEGAITWSVSSLTPAASVMTVVGSFLLMIVWQRLGGGWAMGIFAWMLMAGGLGVVNAGDIGGMIVFSDYTSANIVAVLGTMILGGLGCAVAMMFGDKLLGDEASAEE